MEQKMYKAACYCRLSDDDVNDGMSVSIETQITIHKQYCKANQIQIVDFYCDDGYTGTNFDRPAFQRMLGDVRSKKVNTVIVKDLSRFGREHIEVDYYTQIFFPENDITFIIIADNMIITPHSKYDMMLPLRSVINEMLPAEVSQKVRQAFEAKSKNGEFLHSTVPYGYKKSNTEKTSWLLMKNMRLLLCRSFEVSRSGYYGFVKRMDKPAKDLELSELIRECQIETKQTYGYRRVAIWLERKGVHHDPKTILRVMNKYSLLSVVRRRRYCNYSQALHRYENLLNRDFHADRPNQKWVTDISYIKTAQGFLYLSVIRDLYDRSIVAYKTSTNQNINLVLNTIRAAKRKEKVTADLQLHSDQGFQYTSQPYFNLTQSYHITPSMSRRGNPYDNALAENFFSILKTECIHRTKIKTFDDARRLIDDYIYFYNHQRIQLKTKLTPLELRSQFVP